MIHRADGLGDVTEPRDRAHFASILDERPSKKSLRQRRCLDINSSPRAKFALSRSIGRPMAITRIPRSGCISITWEIRRDPRESPFNIDSRNMPLGLHNKLRVLVPGAIILLEGFLFIQLFSMSRRLANKAGLSSLPTSVRRPCSFCLRSFWGTLPILWYYALGR